MINEMTWMRWLHTLVFAAMTGIWFRVLVIRTQSDMMTRSSYIEEYSQLSSELLFLSVGLVIGFFVGLVTWNKIVIKYQLDERLLALSYLVFVLVASFIV